MSHSRPINKENPSEVKDKAVTPPNNSLEDNNPVVILSSSGPGDSDTRRVRKSELADAPTDNQAPAAELRAPSPVKENGQHEAEVITEKTDNNADATKNEESLFSTLETYFSENTLGSPELRKEAGYFRSLLMAIENNLEKPASDAMKAFTKEMRSILKQKEEKHLYDQANFKSTLELLQNKIGEMTPEALVTAYMTYVNPFKLDKQKPTTEIQCIVSNAVQNNPFLQIDAYLRSTIYSRSADESKLKHNDFSSLLQVIVPPNKPTYVMVPENTDDEQGPHNSTVDKKQSEAVITHKQAIWEITKKYNKSGPTQFMPWNHSGEYKSYMQALSLAKDPASLQREYIDALEKQAAFSILAQAFLDQVKKEEPEQTASLAANAS